jgi:hypothetical protein
MATDWKLFEEYSNPRPFLLSTCISTRVQLRGLSDDHHRRRGILLRRHHHRWKLKRGSPTIRLM